MDAWPKDDTKNELVAMYIVGKLLSMCNSILLCIKLYRLCETVREIANMGYSDLIKIN